ncbi:methyltransferase domain-containing protein [Candidatus Poribacteria bacterium]|nr:methyltransferase domain-containing protein [Candidatus Poribacteria bacterium]
MESKTHKDELSPNSIMDLASAFRKSKVLLTAYEFDLFTALDEKNLSADEVAKKIGSEKRATDRLMNALCAIGLLHKKENLFSNTKLTLQYLVKGKPDYMACLMHSVHLWDTWSTLTDAVLEGKSVVNERMHTRGEAWTEAFIAAMHERATKQVQALAFILDFSNVSRILDVGGGSGAFSMGFVEAKQGIKATVFDLPNVIPITKKYVNAKGLQDKIEFVSGDYAADDFGSGFDMVFLSAIIHINSFEENQNLIRKCSQVLNSKGQIVVQDFIMDDDRTNPPHAALFALNMLVGTESGDTYTELEVKSWMEKSGLSKIVRKDTHYNTTLIIGRKD